MTIVIGQSDYFGFGFTALILIIEISSLDVKQNKGILSLTGNSSILIQGNS